MNLLEFACVYHPLVFIIILCLSFLLIMKRRSLKSIDEFGSDVKLLIMQRLPLKALGPFLYFSEEWKSLIKYYHINHPKPEHYQLVISETENVPKFALVVDENNSLQNNIPLETPQPLRLFKKTLTLTSAHGLLCFFDFETRRAVIWNLIVRKYEDIVFPIARKGFERSIVGFGVCPDTIDANLLRISVNRESRWWEVNVYTLSGRRWERVYEGEEFKSCDFECSKVSLNWFIYLRGYDNIFLPDGKRSNIVIRYHLGRRTFDDLCLPPELVHARYIQVTKVKEAFGILHYYNGLCGVWIDGANKKFTKIYTVEIMGKWLYGNVLGFTNDDKVIIEVEDSEESRIEVYDPLSGQRINDEVGINGRPRKITVRSYMGTAVLFDHTNIH